MKAKFAFVVLLILIFSAAGIFFEKESTFTGKTTKTPQQFISCLAPKWQSNNALTDVESTKSGFKLIQPDEKMGSSSTAYALSGGPDGTSVTVYAASNEADDSLIALAKTCL